MRPSPIRLKHYNLATLHIDPVEGFEPSFDAEPYPSFSNAKFQIGVRIDEAEATADTHPFVLHLKLDGEPKEGKSFPYRFAVAATAIVEFRGGDDANKRRDLIAVNGTSLVYSAVREVLLSLTFRFPNGPMLLPSANFLDMVKKPQTVAAGPSSAEASRPKSKPRKIRKRPPAKA